MTHQKIRKIVQMISTIIGLPLSLWIIFSPILMVFLGAFNFNWVIHLIRWSLVLWGAVFISSFIFQRAYCGHLCPVTGLFTVASYITKSKDVMTMKYPKIMKYIVLGLWGFSFVFVVSQRFINSSHLEGNQTIYNSPEVILYYGLYLVSAILSLTYGKGKTEHYVCPFSPWMSAGIKIADGFNLPSLRIVTDSNQCKKCNRCSKNCSMGLDVLKMVQEESFDQAGCINCGACVEACKFKAVQYSWKVKEK